MSHDENHVSRTAGSRVSSFFPHVPQDAGSGARGFGTVTWPSAQYQAGISCPHQSWRETHQSRMLRIHSSYVFFQGSGRKPVAPRAVAATAFSASGPTFTNHWIETRGSTMVLQRWQRPGGREEGFSPPPRPLPPRAFTNFFPPP